jgi:MOSC domain-containing protein YiiM
VTGPGEPTPPCVVAVHASARHEFSKQVREVIRLVEGLGVEGDAHFGATVQHRSRVRRDPTQPNLRQVHLVHTELHDELGDVGFEVGSGDVGENVTTRGVDLLGMPRGTRLRLGPDAVVEITGLRNPCVQLDRFADGLMQATLDRDAEGRLVRKAGVMAVVVTGGDVRAGDRVTVELPPPPHHPLEPV